MCKIPEIFTNFINNIDNNIFEYEFRYFYYTKLTKELLKLIDYNIKIAYIRLIIYKDCIDYFLNGYVFRGRDYSTATSWSVSLSESIRYTEKVQIDRLKREKLPLPPDYREPTIDLAY